MLLYVIAAKLVAGVMVLGAGTSAVSGQSYPQRSVRLVTQETGGGPDFAARLIAQGLTGPFGQPVIVENRGGGGSISGDIVSKAAPDGHTLLVTGGSFWVATLFRKASYDPVKGFTPVSMLVNSLILLVVPPSSPVKTVKDLIELAKANPGQLNYGAGTPGSITHLSAELFKSMAGVNIVHVPYKGSGPAVIGVIGGQVDMMLATSASVATHVKSGKVRAVAITSARPSVLYPDLPTVAATVPGYDSGGATAMFAPPRTPTSITDRLHRELVRLLEQLDVKEKFQSIGVEIVAGTPEHLASVVKTEMARLGKLVKEAGLRSD